jgi:hypothetical protein
MHLRASTTFVALVTLPSETNIGATGSTLSVLRSLDCHLHPPKHPHFLWLREPEFFVTLTGTVVRFVNDKTG